MVGLDAPAPLHRELVEERSSRLLRSGSLLAEIDSALAAGIPEAALDAAGIGYREALAVRSRRVDVDQAVAELTRRTLRYAKAQRTWFRRDPRIRWLQRDRGPVEAFVPEVLRRLE